LFEDTVTKKKSGDTFFIINMAFTLQQKISNIAIEEVRHKTYRYIIPKREREITYEIQKIYIFNILFQKLYNDYKNTKQYYTI